MIHYRRVPKPCSPLFLLSIAFLLAGTCVNTTLGQTVGPVPELAVEIAPYVTYDLSDNTYFTQFNYSKVASSSQVAPEMNSTGSVYTTFLSVGMRTKDFEDIDFRWRAGLLNMDLVRIPLSMGVSLVDYNKSGYLDLDVTWVNLRLGPSLYLGNPDNYISLRAVGTAGISTLRFGSFSYAGLSSNQGLELKKRAYEVGYLGEMDVFLFDTLSLNASFKYRHLLGGIRPEIYHLNGSIGFRVTESFSFQTTYTIEVVESGPSSIDRSYLIFGIGYLL